MALSDTQFDRLVMLWTKIAGGRANPEEELEASRLESKINPPPEAQPIVEVFKVRRRVRTGYILSNGNKRVGFLPEYEMKYLVHLGLDFRNMKGATIELAVEDDLGYLWKLSRLPIALRTVEDHVGSDILATVLMVTDQFIWLYLGLSFYGQLPKTTETASLNLGDTCKVRISKFINRIKAYRVKISRKPYN